MDGVKMDTSGWCVLGIDGRGRTSADDTPIPWEGGSRSRRAGSTRYAESGERSGEADGRRLPHRAPGRPDHPDPDGRLARVRPPRPSREPGDEPLRFDGRVRAPPLGPCPPGGGRSPRISPHGGAGRQRVRPGRPAPGRPSGPGDYDDGRGVDFESLPHAGSGTEPARVITARPAGTAADREGGERRGRSARVVSRRVHAGAVSPRRPTRTTRSALRGGPDRSHPHPRRHGMKAGPHRPRRPGTGPAPREPRGRPTVPGCPGRR